MELPDDGHVRLRVDDLGGPGIDDQGPGRMAPRGGRAPDPLVGASVRGAHAHRGHTLAERLHRRGLLLVVQRRGSCHGNESGRAGARTGGTTGTGAGSSGHRCAPDGGRLRLGVPAGLGVRGIGDRQPPRPRVAGELHDRLVAEHRADPVRVRRVGDHRVAAVGILEDEQVLEPVDGRPGDARHPLVALEVERRVSAEVAQVEPDTTRGAARVEVDAEGHLVGDRIHRDTRRQRRRAGGIHPSMLPTFVVVIGRDGVGRALAPSLGARRRVEGR